MEHHRREPQSLAKHITGVSITIILVSSTFDGISSPGWAAGKDLGADRLSRAICRSRHHRSAGARTAVIFSHWRDARQVTNAN